MKIGIFGGAFNPPHIGHLVIARQVLLKIGLDKVFFIPTNISPHKPKDDIGSVHRFNMVKSAIANFAGFEALDIEIKRGGVSYTIDTVKELTPLYPAARFYLIIGSDLANSLAGWRNFQELKELVKIIAVQRKESPLREKDDFIIADISPIDISSSRIREMIKRGESVKELIPKEVGEYIREHRLYCI